ncbi:MAG: class I SAM-dependent methyltransferase [Planctomycetota bacterium]|jgi:SAM-dependent methyltransferase
MARLTDQQDAYGHAIYDCHCGRGGYEIAERDDGWVGPSAGPHLYMAEHEDWPSHQRRAIRLARGKVLDIGCGGGRVALHLQEKGLDVLGIDVSPLAIKVCKLRGLRKARLLSITRLSRRLGTFNTLVMYGNNFGLFGSFKRARWLLRRFRGMTGDDARIIAETADPYRTENPCHLRYHERNRARGRMGGQLRLRVRYQAYKTPWFDYLLVSRDEMREILDGTGWSLGRCIDSDTAHYVAVIEKGH